MVSLATFLDAATVEDCRDDEVGEMDGGLMLHTNN